jgi:hypothetical protein
MVLIGKPLMHGVCALAEGAIRAAVIIKPPVANSEIQGFVAAVVMGESENEMDALAMGCRLE